MVIQNQLQLLSLRDVNRQLEGLVPGGLFAFWLYCCPSLLRRSHVHSAWYVMLIIASTYAAPSHL